MASTATCANTEHVPQGFKPAEARTTPGVARIEALFLVYSGRRAHWVLYSCIGLFAFVFSLQTSTVPTFFVISTSSFGQHSLLGAITVANTILAAVVTPFIAKIADVTSRPRAYLLSLFFMILGYILTSASQNVETLAVGQLFSNIGVSSIGFINGIVMADISPLKWRALATAIFSAPPIVNAFIAAPIVEGVLGRGVDHWRWGYAIFLIIVPAAMAPTLIVLFWAEIKAQKLALVAFANNSPVATKASVSKARTVLAQVQSYLVFLDVTGLLLVGGAFSLLLLPMTLHNQLAGGWKDKGIIIMFVFGSVLLIVFAVWELRFSEKPLMSKQILNKTMIISIVISFFYFLASTLQILFFSSWVWVAKDYTYSEWTMMNNTLSVGIAAFCLVAGAAMRYTRRYKRLQLFGEAVLIIGFGVNLYCCRADVSTAALVLGQILISFGGAFLMLCTQTAAQASVKHENMASAIALLSLWSSLGGAIGNAVATAIWTSELPKNLAKQLPDLPAEYLAMIFGSIDLARGSEPAVRARIIDAYVDTAYLIWAPALAMSFIPFIGTLFMENYYLGDTQNAMEDTLITGGPATLLAEKSASSLDEKVDDRVPAKGLGYMANV